MNVAGVTVLIGGIAAVAWVNWYFFASERRSATARTVGSEQRIVVRVDGGYDPAVIHVRRGIPVKLVFDRREDASCSDEVVIPAFSIRRFLPAFKQTEIEFNPTDAGTYDISCGMSMLHAKLVVED